MSSSPITTAGRSAEIFRFHNRHHAGRVLVGHLRHLAERNDLVVLALPRGGVPVAFEVASVLGAPMDVFVVRKLGLPVHPELAMGAIASGGVRVMNEDVVLRYRPTAASIEAATRRERLELERRERTYRNGHPALACEGRTAVLIDDGLATGATMRAAVQGVRLRGPVRIVVGVPVGAREACEALREVADEVVCALTPEPFSAVGLWYTDFSQTTDDEVRELLSTHRAEIRKRSA